MNRHKESIQDIARKVFHHTALREGQEEAITSVLDGHDTLVVMPTGSGKSAIYQIPAVLLSGPTVVVSPLIALQRDQAEYLKRHNVGGAAVVNSLIPEREQEEALIQAGHGDTEFLFMAPEQFAHRERLDAVKAAKPSLFVVDEAHCISEWGHSFRPEYLRLGSVIAELGHPTVLALTATANQAVREEITTRLGMRAPKVFVHGFDRPNIWLGVETASSEARKRAMLFERIQRSPRPGIVYAATRRHAVEINDELNSAGIRSAFYHGGLSKKDREAMQEQFMNDEVEVIVATSAFGMGVDKPNVRFVFHYEPPDSVDSYYQEVGRAGRDGEPASTVLFFNPKDMAIHKFFKSTGQVNEAEVRRVLKAVTTVGEVSVAELREDLGLSKTKLSRALNRLEECGAIEILPEGMVRNRAHEGTIAAKALEASEAQSVLHGAELERIDKMRLYAENMNCRRAYLVNYFGEAYPDECGNCDNCQGKGTLRAELIAETRLKAEQAIAPATGWPLGQPAPALA